MIQAKIGSTKKFMQTLLKTGVFECFLLLEGKVITSCSYTLDGRLQEAFYTKEEWEDEKLHPYEYVKWADMKELVFQMIKGTHVPVYMKFSLMLCPDVARQWGLPLQEQLIKGYVVNIRYENGKILCVTGASYSGFSMDKEPENKWDHCFELYLQKNEIEYEK